ncbi:MAG: hypothetical protein ABUL46_03790, partial [Chitinophaga rupis]
MKVLTIAILSMTLLCRLQTFAQNQTRLTDGRVGEALCASCRQFIISKPKEVLFGITVNGNGEVFFEMNNDEWFNKMFTPGMGITVDIVTGDRYSCNN